MVGGAAISFCGDIPVAMSDTALSSLFLIRVILSDRNQCCKPRWRPMTGRRDEVNAVFWLEGEPRSLKRPYRVGVPRWTTGTTLRSPPGALHPGSTRSRSASSGRPTPIESRRPSPAWSRLLIRPTCFGPVAAAGDLSAQDWHPTSALGGRERARTAITAIQPSAPEKLGAPPSVSCAHAEIQASFSAVR
jgi:hypothetical protein